MSSINSSEKISTNENLEPKDVSEMNTSKPLLPRSAWNSQVAFLRAIFRAKKALDKMNFSGQLLTIAVLNIAISTVYIGSLRKSCKDKNISDFKSRINGES